MLTAAIKKTVASVIIWLDYSIHFFTFFDDIRVRLLKKTLNFSMEFKLEKQIKLANINNRDIRKTIVSAVTRLDYSIHIWTLF